jgi:cytochrome b involved in lipid metabolism
MMRNLRTASTVSFWLLAGALAPQAFAQTNAMSDKTYSLAQVGEHASPGDCWMAIHGKVYDVTAFLPSHPSRPQVIEAWCGKEASDAYDTKTKGRRHSQTADRKLKSYLIGDLK